MNDSEVLERAGVLLQAAYDILDICEKSPYVVDAINTGVRYDGTICDGACLKTDIQLLLEEIRSNKDDQQ